jgi:hypothetical protein
MFITKIVLLNKKIKVCNRFKLKYYYYIIIIIITTFIYWLINDRCRV